MAIAIDQANIGNAANNATGTSLGFTTTQNVAANGFIVVTVCWFSTTVTLSSISGGGLTWAVDVQGAASGGGNGDHSAVCSAQAPAGLASGTVLTANFSATTPGRGIAGTSFTGVLPSAALDTTNGPIDVVATSAWSTGSTAIAAGSVLIAASYDVNSNDTNTVTVPSIQAQFVDGGAGNFSMVACYRIEPSAGSYTVAGTWSSSSANGVVNAAAYKVDPNPPTVIRPTAPRPRAFQEQGQIYSGEKTGFQPLAFQIPDPGRAFQEGFRFGEQKAFQDGAFQIPDPGVAFQPEAFDDGSAFQMSVLAFQELTGFQGDAFQELYRQVAVAALPRPLEVVLQAVNRSSVW